MVGSLEHTAALLSIKLFAEPQQEDAFPGFSQVLLREAV